MPDRLAEGAKQDISLRREAQAARHAYLSQPGVPIVGRSLRHRRKGTRASTAVATPPDANTQLIIITIAIDSRRSAMPRVCATQDQETTPRRERGRKENGPRD
jgi:hypothetical protein